MNVDFDSKTVTLNLEDVRQIFNMQFGNTELGSFEIVVVGDCANVVDEKQQESDNGLWYPDDGDWIEVSNSDTEPPVPLDTFVYWLLTTEREDKTFDSFHTSKLNNLRDSSGKYYPGIVAIKVA